MNTSVDDYQCFGGTFFLHLRGGYSRLYSTIIIPSDQEGEAPLFSILLLRYRDQNLLYFHDHIHSGAAERIYCRTSFSLLRERIHDTRHALNEISRALLRLHMRLAGELSAMTGSFSIASLSRGQNRLQLTTKPDSAVSSGGYTGLSTL
jgi:hypothetical protein